MMQKVKKMENKRLNIKELKMKLKTNKNFIKYNGSDEINTIVEMKHKLLNQYFYIINNKIKVEYTNECGNVRERKMYLRITKIKNIEWYSDDFFEKVSA